MNATAGAALTVCPVCGRGQAHSVAEFAREAGIGLSLAWEMVRQGRVRSLSLGRRRLIPAAAMRELLS